MWAWTVSSSMIWSTSSRFFLYARSPAFSNSLNSFSTVLWSSLSRTIASIVLLLTTYPVLLRVEKDLDGPVPLLLEDLVAVRRPVEGEPVGGQVHDPERVGVVGHQ